MRYVHTIKVRSRTRMKMTLPRHVLVIAPLDRVFWFVKTEGDEVDIPMIVETVEMVESVFEGPSVDQGTPLAVIVCETVLYSPKSRPWIGLYVGTCGGVGDARVSTIRLSLRGTCMA
jgi:hypothetical protein